MHADTLGWSAAALMLATFATAQPRAMRVLAVLTNVTFIAYGLKAGLVPVVALHALLLPVNAWRGAQAFAIGTRWSDAARRLRGAAFGATLLLASLLAACGRGGSDGDAGKAPPQLVPPPRAPPPALPATAVPPIGAAGGTVQLAIAAPHRLTNDH